jgi:hypothetical protein
MKLPRNKVSRDLALFKLKQAGLTLLGDDTASWGSKILSALHKEHTYLGNYALKMVIEAEDPKVGAAQGCWVVESSAGSTPYATNEYMERPGEDYQSQAVAPPQMPSYAPGGGPVGLLPPNEAGGMQQASMSENLNGKTRVPFLVEDGKLHPMLVFITRDDRYLFLNERNMLTEMGGAVGTVQSMANSSTAMSMAGEGDSISNGVVDGTGQDNVISRGLLKTASAIVLSVPRPERVSGITKLLNASGLHPDKLPSKYKQKLARYREVEAPPRSFGHVTAARLTRDGGDYVLTFVAGGKLKQAQLEYRELKALPNQLVQDALTKGTGTVIQKTAKPIVGGEEDLPSVEGGVYRLFRPEGTTEDVLAVPATGDGTVVFSSDGVSYHRNLRGMRLSSQNTSFLEKVAYKRQPACFDIGVFVTPDRVATPPVKILATHRDFGGVNTFRAQDIEGNEVNVAISSAVTRYMQEGNEVLLPQGSEFIAAKSFAADTTYAGEIPLKAKTANFVSRGDYTVISLNTGVNGWDFEYQCGHKRMRQADVTREDATLLLRSCGFKQKEAAKLLLGSQRSRQRFAVPARYLPDVETAPVEPPFTLSQKELGGLFKYAALSSAAPTLDAILALQFVSSENTSKFIELIPLLEDVSSKLSELYVASIVGYRDVSTTSCATALRAVEKVLDGLRTLEMTSFNDVAR